VDHAVVYHGAPYGDNALNAHAWVPIDDENCFVWTFTYHPTRPLSTVELDVMRKGGGIHVELIPGTFRPVINKDNNYMIDRKAQREGRTYSGVTGIALQDASVQESMGSIADRTKENLVSTDNAIIMARHRLRRAALALQQGAAPPGLNEECQRVRSASFVLPLGVPFAEARREDLQARPKIPHTSI
jgi:phthalate 4,5-dioxygenase